MSEYIKHLSFLIFVTSPQFIKKSSSHYQKEIIMNFARRKNEEMTGMALSTQPSTDPFKYYYSFSKFLMHVLFFVQIMYAAYTHFHHSLSIFLLSCRPFSLAKEHEVVARGDKFGTDEPLNGRQKRGSHYYVVCATHIQPLSLYNDGRDGNSKKGHPDCV